MSEAKEGDKVYEQLAGEMTAAHLAGKGRKARDWLRDYPNIGRQALYEIAAKLNIPNAIKNLEHSVLVDPVKGERARIGKRLLERAFGPSSKRKRKIKIRIFPADDGQAGAILIVPEK